MSMWEKQQGYKNKQRLGSTSHRKGQNCEGRRVTALFPKTRRYRSWMINTGIEAEVRQVSRLGSMKHWKKKKKAPIITIEPGVGLCCKSPTRSAWDAPKWMHKSQSNEPSDDTRWHPRSADLPGTVRWAHGLWFVFCFFPIKLNDKSFFGCSSVHKRHSGLRPLRGEAMKLTGFNNDKNISHLFLHIYKQLGFRITPDVPPGNCHRVCLH